MSFSNKIDWCANLSLVAALLFPTGNIFPYYIEFSVSVSPTQEDFHVWIEEAFYSSK